MKYFFLFFTVLGLSSFITTFSFSLIKQEGIHSALAIPYDLTKMTQEASYRILASSEAGNNSDYDISIINRTGGIVRFELSYDPNFGKTFWYNLGRCIFRNPVGCPGFMSFRLQKSGAPLSIRFYNYAGFGEGVVKKYDLHSTYPTVYYFDEVPGLQRGIELIEGEMF